MWNCTLTTVHQGISQGKGGGGLGYNRYISTLSDVPLAFLLIYGLLRSWDEDEDGDGDYTSQCSKVFLKIFTNLSLTHAFALPLTRAVALSFVLFSAVVTKASNFVANFKQIFRFALLLFVLSLPFYVIVPSLMCEKCVLTCWNFYFLIS